MANHTQLPIYKETYELLQHVIKITKNMPRDFKQSMGGKLRDECIEISVMIFRANVAADKLVHLNKLIERLRVAVSFIKRFAAHFNSTIRKSDRAFWKHRKASINA